MLVAHAASFSHLVEEERRELLCEFILFILRSSRALRVS